MKDIQLNPQRAEAISRREGPMIVLSVAGSGYQGTGPKDGSGYGAPANR